MICLPSTQTLQAVLGSGETAQYTATWVIKSTGAVGQSNGTLGSTDTNIVSAPSSSDYNLVKQITLYNDDTTSITATIKLDASGTETILCVMSIPVGGTLFYSPENGFVCSKTGGWELSYTEITSSVQITSTDYASPTTIITAPAITLDGNSTILINFYTSHMYLQASRNVYLHLWDGTSNVGLIHSGGRGVSDTSPLHSVNVSRRLKPSAGSHTYAIKGTLDSAGTVVSVTAEAGGSSGVWMPAYLQILRVG